MYAWRKWVGQFKHVQYYQGRAADKLNKNQKKTFNKYKPSQGRGNKKTKTKTKDRHMNNNDYNLYEWIKKKTKHIIDSL